MTHWRPVLLFLSRKGATVGRAQAQDVGEGPDAPGDLDATGLGPTAQDHLLAIQARNTLNALERSMPVCHACRIAPGPLAAHRLLQHDQP